MRQLLGMALLSSAGAMSLCAVSLPLVFERNSGQAPDHVQLIARAKGATLLLGGAEAVLRSSTATTRMRFEGALPTARIEGNEPLSGQSLYYIGAKTIRAPHFARARYTGLYKGIDAVYYERDGNLEYDFLLSPGADPSQIRLRFPDATAIAVDPNGDLRLRYPTGEIRQARPVAFQYDQGRRIEVSAAFSITPSREVRFTLGNYNRQLPLTIDPVIVYSALFGGSAIDPLRTMAVDAAGSAIMGGTTSSLDILATPGLPPRPGNNEVGYVVKFNPAGTAIVFVAFLGGNAHSGIDALTVDRSGNIYITGETHAQNFPVSEDAAQRVHRSFNAVDPNNREDAFITKLSPTGSIIYSTLIGGELSDVGRVIAVDGAGNAYIGGISRSASLPLSNNAFQRTYRGGGFDGFVIKLNAGGTAVMYGTYLGGREFESVRGIAVDSAGSAAVVLENVSNDMTVTPNALQSTTSRFATGYFARLDPQGASLTYATYIGGNGTELFECLTMDSTGAVFIGGTTDSTDFPTTPGAFQRTQRDEGAFAGFVMKFSPANTLAYSTLLGAKWSDSVDALAIDRAGNAIAAGTSFSPDFPTAYPSQFYVGSADTSIVRLNSTGSAILDSTFFGHEGVDGASAVAIDDAGAVYVAGITTSQQFPVTPGSASSPRRGVNDGYIAKFTFSDTRPPVALQAMVDAASFIGGPIAPGEIVTLFGTPIGPSALAGLQLDGANVATTLAGTRVLFNGVPAPLIYASAGQTSVVVPYSVAGNSRVGVQVEYNGQSSQVVQSGVVAARPAIFTANSSGSGPGAILNEDGSVNTAARPAAPGSVIILYGTGGGAVNPPATTGGIATGAASLALPVVVEFGSGNNRPRGTVLYAGSAPGLVNGVMQINVRLPASVTGEVPLRVTVGTAVSPTVTVAVAAN